MPSDVEYEEVGLYVSNGVANAIACEGHVVEG